MTIFYDEVILVQRMKSSFVQSLWSWLFFFFFWLLQVMSLCMYMTFCFDWVLARGW